MVVLFSNLDDTGQVSSLAARLCGTPARNDRICVELRDLRRDRLKKFEAQFFVRFRVSYFLIMVG